MGEFALSVDVGVLGGSELSYDVGVPWTLPVAVPLDEGSAVQAGSKMTMIGSSRGGINTRRAEK